MTICTCPECPDGASSVFIITSSGWGGGSGGHCSNLNGTFAMTYQAGCAWAYSDGVTSMNLSHSSTGWQMQLGESQGPNAAIYTSPTFNCCNGGGSWTLQGGVSICSPIGQFVIAGVGCDTGCGSGSSSSSSSSSCGCGTIQLAVTCSGGTYTLTVTTPGGQQYTATQTPNCNSFSLNMSVNMTGCPSGTITVTGSGGSSGNPSSHATSDQG